MPVNFGMWRKAAWELIKLDDKREWDALDVISKWLIATRSAVTAVTIYSSIIGGLLAWRDGHFSFLPWLIVTLGLFIAHGTNNLLNDYTDYTRGVDKDNYFRTQYGVHPLVQGFWTKSQQIQWFLVSGAIAFLSGPVCAVVHRLQPAGAGAVCLWRARPPVLHLADEVLGAGRTLDFPDLGPGDDCRRVPGSLRRVELDGRAGEAFPSALSVASINVAKHTDKLEDDKSKGVGTFPVRVGQTFARYTTIAAIVIAYAVILYLVATGYFSTFLLLVLFGARRAFYAIAVLSKPRPAGPASRFRGLLADLVLRLHLLPQPHVRGDVHSRRPAGCPLPPDSLPVNINLLGLIALAIGVLVALVRMRGTKPATR